MTISTFDTPRDSERERNARRFDARDDDDDVTLDEPGVAQERDEERDRAAARQNATERATGNDEHRQFGTSYLGESTDSKWQQWRQIQSDFVDNPRTAVSNAHRLVGEVMDDIVHRFEDERNQLEQRWSSGQDVGTEELRTCLQTYRDFFGRLLNVGDTKA